jgi:hypothetical protein
VSEFKTWDQYADEARIEAFQLPVSKDEVLTIAAPSGAAIIQWSRAYRSGDSEAMLSALTGDHYARIRELVSRAPFEAMQNLVTDIMVHFRLTDEIRLEGPGGGTITERDPRKVQKLIGAGYKPAGEARSRP